VECGHAELQSGDPAVHCRAVILDTGWNRERLRFHVHRDSQKRFRLVMMPRPLGERRTDGYVQRGRAGNTGAGRRVASRRQGQTLRTAVRRYIRPSQKPVREERQQPQLSGFAKLRPVAHVDGAARVLGTNDNAPVVARMNGGTSTEADCGIDRLRPVVKQVQRPDVDGATGEVDTRWRGRGDVHDAIIMMRCQHPFGAISASC
jgi:hypothetical protein